MTPPCWRLRCEESADGEIVDSDGESQSVCESCGRDLLRGNWARFVAYEDGREALKPSDVRTE